MILDEPTSGLDPLMEEVFTQCLAEAKAAGTSILLSSHILSEVDRVADTVTIIKDGASVETGSLASLRHLSRTRVEATLSRPVDLANTAGVHDLQADGDRVSFSVESADLGRLLGELADGLAQFVEALEPERLFMRGDLHDAVDRGEPRVGPRILHTGQSAAGRAAR